MNVFIDIETIPAQDPAVIEALREDMREALDEALAETVEWYRANRAWWEPLKG